MLTDYAHVGSAESNTMLLLHMLDELGQRGARLRPKMLKDGHFDAFPLRPSGIPLKRQHFHNA